MSRSVIKMRPDIREAYMGELAKIIHVRHGRKSYFKLLQKLHAVPFNYDILMDENRFADGVSLRYIIGRELGYPDAVIATLLDDKPCSVLEMLVALCLSIEERIMSDPECGDRTSEWFWLIMGNLGLHQFHDMTFDWYQSDHEIDGIMDIFLNHQYHRDGSNGGAFIIPDIEPGKDMRKTELWYQACWYLNTIFDREDFLNEG